MRAVITGTGMHVPDNVVDNDRLSRVMDTSDAWVRKRTGIVTRHFADLDQATSDLAVPAARQAVSEAGLEPEQIDYVIFATMTPDYYFPGSSKSGFDVTSRLSRRWTQAWNRSDEPVLSTYLNGSSATLRRRGEDVAAVMVSPSDKSPLPRSQENGHCH